MWTYIENKCYYLPDINGQYNAIYYFNLDFGIVWSLTDKEYPTGSKKNIDWTWATDNVPLLHSKINNLWSKNILPVFYANKINIDTFKNILDNFDGFIPPCFMNFHLDNLNILIKQHWIKKIQSANFPSLRACTFPENISFYHMGPPYNIVDITNLSIIEYNDYPNDVNMIIIMGSPSCGKTTYANYLKEQNWLVLSQYEICEIASAFNYNIPIKIEYFKYLLTNINKYNGIVIDGYSTTIEQRKLWYDLAEEFNLNAIIAVLRRPGYIFNQYRNQPVSNIVFKIFYNTVSWPLNNYYYVY